MDKITAGIIDKLSIFGFFNLIISGGVLLYGITPLLDVYAPGILYSELGVENDLEKGAIIVLLCYILGGVLKGLQELLFKEIKDSAVKKCLADPDKAGKEGGIIKNKYTRKSIIGLAVKMFGDKSLGQFDPEDKAMCQSFFEYCEQSNSVFGYGSKAGNLSESAAFFEQLAAAFFTLTVVGVLLSLFSGKSVWFYCLVYLVMGGIFLGRAYNNHQKWAKTVLATYEAVLDMEALKAKEEG